MRVSTAQVYIQGLRGFQQQQVSIAKLQQQISSGKKNLRPSDNPAEVSRAQDLQQIVERTEQYLRNIDIAESRLKQEETALNSVNNSLIRVRELAVQGASTTLSQPARQALVEEMRERISEIVSLGNTVDPHGDYIFGGNKGSTVPFTQSAVLGYSVTSFVGDQGSRSVQVSESDQVETSDSGSDVFMKIRGGTAVSGVADLNNTSAAQIAPVFRTDASLVTGNDYRIEFTSATTFDIINDTTATTVSSGNNYVSGQAIEFDGLRTTITGTTANADTFRIRNGQYQDVFTTLNKMVLALERGASTTADRTRLSSNMAESIVDIDNALENINQYRTKIGGRMNVMDAYKDQSDAYIVDTKSAISLLSDVDIAEAITTLQRNTLSLQAAQSTFARVQQNSLFTYL